MSEAPTLASPAPTGEREILPFRFTGSAGEYFRIWIVNLCLTVVTLGLYSPWAKVRTRRYFYSNLHLDGSSFQYTADPVRILVGRLIVGGVLLFNSLAGSFFPPLAAILTLGLFVLTPWAMVRSIAFHHRYSLYRGVRFRFQGHYGQAFMLYIVWPFLLLLSLGLAYPWWEARQHDFLVRHTSYGATPFGFRWKAASYYAVFLRGGVALATFSAIAAALVFIVAPMLTGSADAPMQEPPAGGLAVATLLGLLVWGAGFVAAFAVLKAGFTNLLYTQGWLAGHRFRSTLRGQDFAWLYVSSGFVIALTLGLAVPWAVVRIARYRAENLQLVADGDLGGFVQGVADDPGLGEIASEAADVFDLDFGL